METHFKNVRTPKDLINSCISIIVGIALYFVSPGFGIFFAAGGLLLLLFCKSGYKASNEGPVLKKKTIEVAHSCRQSLIDFLDGKDVEPELNRSGAGSILRLEAYFSKEAGVAYVQLFDYINYTYEKATELVELHSPQADKIINKL